MGVKCPCRREESQSVLDEAAEGDEVQTKPEPAKLPWEMNRKPDPRRKWCDVVQGKVLGKICPGERKCAIRVSIFIKNVTNAT